MKRGEWKEEGERTTKERAERKKSEEKWRLKKKKLRNRSKTQK